MLMRNYTRWRHKPCSVKNRRLRNGMHILDPFIPLLLHKCGDAENAFCVGFDQGEFSIFMSGWKVGKWWVGCEWLCIKFYFECSGTNIIMRRREASPFPVRKRESRITYAHPAFLKQDKKTTRYLTFAITLRFIKIIVLSCFLCLHQWFVKS